VSWYFLWPLMVLVVGFGEEACSTKDEECGWLDARTPAARGTQHRKIAQAHRQGNLEPRGWKDKGRFRLSRRQNSCGVALV